MDCIFCKIAEHKIKSNILYEDRDIIVFPDINPVADYHILVVPKKHITDFFETKKEELILNSIIKRIYMLIEKEKLMGKGYRLVVNGGGAQFVDHLHFHLIGKISVDRKL